MRSSTTVVDAESAATVAALVDLPPWLLEAARQGCRLLSRHDPAHDWGHARRVAQMTARAGVECGADPLQAVAAALLHDLVQAPKGTRGCAQAGRASATLASDILIRAGAPVRLVNEVGVAIAEHPSSAGRAPSTALSAALQDGDRLDALGAVGVARTLTVGALLGRPFLGAPEHHRAGRPLVAPASTFHHVLDRLVGLADGMHTAYGRAEAQRRRAQMLEYFGALAEQCGDGR